MRNPRDPFRVFEHSIGNNLSNNHDDVLNAKYKFKHLGYYNDDVISGYIDDPLIRSIKSYQRHKGLQIDGYMNPGGETESHIYGDLLGLPESGMRIQDRNFRVAVAPTIPAIFAIGRGVRAAKKAWDVWRSVPPGTRQNDIDKICEDQFELDYQECVTRHKDKESQRICIKPAMERRAKCIHSRSNENLPPLYK